MNKKILAVLAVAFVCALAPALSSAQSVDGNGVSAGSAYRRGYGMGPGMMGGYGGGSSQRAASDDRDDGTGGGQMGPRMMDGDYGGYDHWGMGPWMMGSGACGMGSWMMDGYNPGSGGWAPALASLNLSDAQIRQIDAIRDARDKKQWSLMTEMHDAMISSRHNFEQPSLDVDATMKTATAISGLRLQMMRNRLETQKQILGILTTQQQQELRQYGRRRW